MIPRSIHGILITVACASVVLTANAEPVLLATDVKPGQRDLLRLDPATGAATVIGSIGVEIAGMTYDSKNDILYAGSTRTLYRIDPDTAALHEIGPFGMEKIHTVEYDSIQEVLYGIRSEMSPYSLCTIDVTTGQATIVAPIAANGLIGMAFDPASGIMYASDIYRQKLVTVDLATGALSYVGSFNAGVQVGTGLAYSPIYGLMAADNYSNSYIEMTCTG